MRHIRLAGHQDKVWSVAFADDDKLLASASEDRTVRLWDLASAQEMAVLEGHNAGVNAVAFAPRGTYLASGGEDGLVKLWHWRQRRACAVQEHRGGVNALAFSADARYLASAGGMYARRGEIRIWDLAGHYPVTSLGCSDEILCLAFAPGGRLLAAGDTGGAIKLWSIPTRSLQHSWNAHLGSVRCLRFHPKGHSLVSGGDDGKVRFWETASGLEIARLKATGVLAADFTPDGKRLAIGCLDGQVKSREVAPNRPWERLGGHEQAVFSVAFSGDGKFLAAGSQDGAVTIWDAGAMKRQPPWKCPPGGDVRFPGRPPWRRFAAESSHNHLCLRMR